ncbi:MAG: hypothetical protein ATN35_00010 [Epulopiscium sp. Nele67-Bin004]|nr:MAG: hypothetical protein ATN35_00010 [Epulopiscium sp. Nele67-Bin004]
MNENKQFLKLYWHQLKLVFIAIIGMKIFYHLWRIVPLLISFGFRESDFVLYLSTPLKSALLFGISALIGLISSTRIFDSFLKIKANRKASFFGTIVGGLSLIGTIGVIWIGAEWLEIIILNSAINTEVITYSGISLITIALATLQQFAFYLAAYVVGFWVGCCYLRLNPIVATAIVGITAITVSEIINLSYKLFIGQRIIWGQLLIALIVLPIVSYYLLKKAPYYKYKLRLFVKSR